jgi:type II secretory pathway pseudopilin PulG
LELLVGLAILGILLGLATVGSRQALAARTLDTTGRELEEALRFARQGAQNSQGSTMRFQVPTAGLPGNWQVLLWTRVAMEGVLDRDLQLTLEPASPAALEFTAAGTLASDRTLVLTSMVTGRSLRWHVHATTGVAERQQ